ncbi:hypothetical protein F3J40_15880 [Pantoea sp. Acro-835]|uniref:Uncharacterized protein n=1 Tax=Candidatus Pantoea multigeneris TaxID=2608357 RepID=A0ABX0RCJ9_9GAMM|nr:hypothetical protein [Pantoea multigeneris]
MKGVNITKNIVGFILCFIVAFWMSSYGKPLYTLTSWVVEHAYLMFGKYQSGSYEAESDPVTFSSLILVVCVYAGILFLLIKRLLRK